MEVTVNTIDRYDSNKDGEPYETKDGEPFHRVAIGTEEFDSKIYLNDFDDRTEGVTRGDTLNIEQPTENEYGLTSEFMPEGTSQPSLGDSKKEGKTQSQKVHYIKYKMENLIVPAIHLLLEENDIEMKDVNKKVIELSGGEQEEAGDDLDYPDEDIDPDDIPF